MQFALKTIMLYSYTDFQQFCVEYLVNRHVKHHIEPTGAAKHNQRALCLEKMDLELEDVKESANVRLTEIKHNIKAERYNDACQQSNFIVHLFKNFSERFGCSGFILDEAVISLLQSCLTLLWVKMIRNMVNACLRETLK